MCDGRLVDSEPDPSSDGMRVAHRGRSKNNPILSGAVGNVDSAVRDISPDEADQRADQKS